jgi:glycosyltransferase involved in cell wall biosynthesis
MNYHTRVAMIIQGYHPRIGGAERQLMALAPLLQERGVDVQILTRRYPGLAPFEMIQGVPVHRLPIPGPKALASMTFTIAALPLLRRLRPDVIHAHELFSPTTTAVTAKRWLGIPVVVKILRGGIAGDILRLKHKTFGDRRIANFRRNVDAFITISEEIDAELAGIGIPPERRPFIPNGVDTHRFAPLPSAQKQAQRAALGLPATGPIAVFAGRLASEKRIDQLVSVWPAVRAAHPDAHLVVLGTGPEEEALKRSAGAGVHFAGRTEDVAPYLQAADLFVLPSATEGLSNALLEAMSCGLVTIATSVGGAPDLIEHDVSGWLIPPDQPPALQAALLTLLGDPARWDRLGQRARERVINDYALPVIASRLCALYQQVTRKQPAPSPALA